MVVWSVVEQPLPSHRGLWLRVHRAGASATYGELLEGLEGAADLRTLLTARLAAVPWTAFRWESPPVTKATLDRPAECVVLDCPSLDRRPTAHTFAEYWTQAPVVEFASLGRDAWLVVPCPRGNPDAYAHLAAFVRRAPAAQQHALWQHVAGAMRRRLGRHPVWLSTAGDAVAWLHVRLDDRPKYYHYAPYRSFPPSATDAY